MINNVNNKYMVGNVEIVGIYIGTNTYLNTLEANGGFLFDKERQEKKPSYYKINLLEFINVKFKSINEAKQYLKSDSTITKLLNLANEKDIEIINTANELKRNQKLLKVCRTKLIRYDNLESLTTRQQHKLNKWLDKNT